MRRPRLDIVQTTFNPGAVIVPLDSLTMVMGYLGAPSFLDERPLERQAAHCGAAFHAMSSPRKAFVRKIG
jgi:hypothetical protein